jgi:hypothetical protein
MQYSSSVLIFSDLFNMGDPPFRHIEEKIKKNKKEEEKILPWHTSSILKNSVGGAVDGGFGRDHCHLRGPSPSGRLKIMKYIFLY